MIFAVLRGILLFIVTTVVVFFVVQITILMDRGRWFEDFAEWFVIPISFGWSVGIVGYATHPSAKGLPKPWQDRLSKWFESWGLRGLIGLVTGLIVAWSFFLSVVFLTWIFGLVQWDTDARWRVAPAQRTKQTVAVSITVSAASSAFFASIVATLICPRWVKIQAISQFAAKRAVAGLVAGAWLGAGAGMALSILVDWGYLDWRSEQMVDLTAACCGSVGGILVAIALRLYFKS